MRPFVQRLLAICCGSLLLPLAIAVADDTFIDSDEYEDGDAAVNKFLTDVDYRIMFEDLERHDTKFDWAWWPGPPATESLQHAKPKQGRLRGLFRSRGSRKQPTGSLGFRVDDYHSVHVPPVQNYAGICPKEHLEQIRDAFVEAAIALNLRDAGSEQSAELIVELALIDQMRSDVHVPVYGIRVQPFIEMVLRLAERSTGARLLLARHRRHGRDHLETALNYADDPVRFLR